MFLGLSLSFLQILYEILYSGLVIIFVFENKKYFGRTLGLEHVNFKLNFPATYTLGDSKHTHTFARVVHHSTDIHIPTAFNSLGNGISFKITGICINSKNNNPHILLELGPHFALAYLLPLWDAKDTTITLWLKVLIL